MIYTNSIFQNNNIQQETSYSTLPIEIVNEIFGFLNNKELMMTVRMLNQDYKERIESLPFKHHQNMLEGFNEKESKSLLFFGKKIGAKKKKVPYYSIESEEASHFLEKITVKDIFIFFNLYTEYQGKPLPTRLKNNFLSNIEEGRPVYSIKTQADGDNSFYVQSDEISLLKAASITAGELKNIKKISLLLIAFFLYNTLYEKKDTKEFIVNIPVIMFGLFIIGTFLHYSFPHQALSTEKSSLKEQLEEHINNVSKKI